MTTRALLPLFLQSAKADFACVAANLFAGIDFLQSAKADFACVAANSFAGIGFLQSAKADFACVAANSFAGNIRRDWLSARALLPSFFSPQRQTISCATATYNRRGLVRIGTG